MRGPETGDQGTTALRLLAATLERAIDRYLALDPEAAAGLGAMEGGVVAIEVAGFDLRLYLRPEGGRIRVETGHGGEPDTLIRGTPLGLARLTLGPTTSLSGSGVEIHGDTEAGEALRGVLQSVQFDWEEQLARLTGDAVAHQVGMAVRRLQDAVRQAGATLTADVSEYLREEAGLLPGQAEADDLYAGIDAARMDTDRLEARIRRLEAALARRATTDPGDSA
jgi:ubiquinone biosynthesis protein UbiJ